MNAQTAIEASPEVQLVAALARALPELGAVHKNKKNPAFKSNYADLSAVIGALAPLAEHGLWFRQSTIEADKAAAVETFYVHEAGGVMSAGITSVPVNKADAHGYGSALTYARRYALVTAFGLSADDDDGNAAAKSPPRQREEQPAAKLDDATLTKIIALCEAVGGNQAGLICNAYKIDSLPELTASKADAVINKLERKLAERARAASNAEAANA